VAIQIDSVCTMQGATIIAPRLVQSRPVPRPEPEPGEVLIRIEGCGLCASSLPLWAGRPWFDYPLEPGAPGHEAWGVEVQSGRRFALLSYHGFAGYEAVEESSMVPLPPELDDMAFPGEALGCAMNVFARSGVRSGDRVAVVGAGFLGLLLVQLCVAEGAEVFACSRRRSAVELAQSFGAESRSQPPPESCSVVIEAAGQQETLDLASALVATGGRLVIAGFHQDGHRTVDLQSWNWRGLDVINAHERSPEVSLAGMRAAVQAVLAGTLRPEPLYTHVFPLTELADAFEVASRRPEGFVKALVVP
jgi:threonine dehydrogenase-like Zn-dependent dehydrogenase